MKALTLIIAIVMAFGFVTPAMAHDYDGLGYGNDPGEMLMLPFKVVWDVLSLPFYVAGGLFGGSYYERGYGSWYTPSWDNRIR